MGSAQILKIVFKHLHNSIIRIPTYKSSNHEKYLAELGVGSSYIGVCLGALNFAALGFGSIFTTISYFRVSKNRPLKTVTNIPFGKLADNKDNVRWVGASLALCGALGNAIYMCVPKVEAVVFSRVMSGITSSIEPILFGILGRSVQTENQLLIKKTLG